MYVPWTGLGLYGGFRGNRWLKNRIKVFKQFVLPSLLAQTNQNFTVWFSWRPEEKNNPIVKEFIKEMSQVLRLVNTWHGVCFWDDKYPDPIAKGRLMAALHGSMGELFDTVGEAESVLMTIQPSDDCYHKDFVKNVQEMFAKLPVQAIGFKRGYMINYQTLETAEYNPKTNPPFFTIKFPRETFVNPYKHLEYTGPYKSHEYVPDHLSYGTIEARGFLVGTHGENISTVFNHPYKGQRVEGILEDFGLESVEPLKIRLSVRRYILRMLPHRIQRKLRYYLGERFWQKIYEFLRS